MSKSNPFPRKEAQTLVRDYGMDAHAAGVLTGGHHQEFVNLLTWVGKAIATINQNGRRSNKFCVLCKYTKVRRTECRHVEIWRLTGTLPPDDTSAKAVEYQKVHIDEAGLEKLRGRYEKSLWLAIQEQAAAEDERAVAIVGDKLYFLESVDC